MRTAWWLALALVLSASTALCANVKLEEARRLVDDLELEKAAKALDAAERVEGNDLATTLDILALQGIVYGTLGKDAKAKDAFRELLVLSPKYKLPADQPPRVRTPFYEAKAWAEDNGPLTVTPGAEAAAGQVAEVQVAVEPDVLRLAKSVRFHLKVGGSERTVDALLSGGRAAAPVGAAQVDWWAQVLGARGRVLLEVGSAAAPRHEGREGAAVVATTSPDEKPSPGAVKDGVLAPEVAKPAGGGAWMRPVGFSLLGAGVVAGGVGVVFGLLANGARAKVLDAQQDANGLVTGVTQREAAALEQQARTNAIVANVLFGAGAALAATGLVFVLLGGGQDAAPVSFVPGPGGLLVSGSF